MHTEAAWLRFIEELAEFGGARMRIALEDDLSSGNVERGDPRHTGLT
jgi:hypothetical protein